jgi:hypothetical protein
MSKAIWFEGISTGTVDNHAPQSCFQYRKIAFRNPKKGEWYLSGAIVTAYRARNDMTSPYHIVEPIRYDGFKSRL